MVWRGVANMFNFVFFRWCCFSEFRSAERARVASVGLRGVEVRHGLIFCRSVSQGRITSREKGGRPFASGQPALCEELETVLCVFSVSFAACIINGTHNRSLFDSKLSRVLHLSFLPGSHSFVFHKMLSVIASFSILLSFTNC